MAPKAMYGWMSLEAHTCGLSLRPHSWPPASLEGPDKAACGPDAWLVLTGLGRGSHTPPASLASGPRPLQPCPQHTFPSSPTYFCFHLSSFWNYFHQLPRA